MVKVRFTALENPPGGLAVPFDYDDPISFDIVSDPMTVTTTSTGYEDDGTPVEDTNTREYLKSEYSGEVIEEGL